MQDHRYYHPSKASYENDGKPSAGYGNRSSNNTTPWQTQYKFDIMYLQPQ